MTKFSVYSPTASAVAVGSFDFLLDLIIDDF